MEEIKELIYPVRGVHVMLDRDLARLYHVQTKVLNQAVKRNIQRFPDRFMFQLDENEAEKLLCSRSQFVTLNKDEGNLKSQSDVAVQPPMLPEQLFATGCVWDAYSYVCDLVRSAERRIVLIDNFVDDRTLKILDKCAEGVEAVEMKICGIMCVGMVRGT